MLASLQGAGFHVKAVRCKAFALDSHKVLCLLDSLHGNDPQNNTPWAASEELCVCATFVPPPSCRPYWSLCSLSCLMTLTQPVGSLVCATEVVAVRIHWGPTSDA